MSPSTTRTTLIRMAAMVVEGASHWITLDAPDGVNALLVNWLHEPDPAG